MHVVDFTKLFTQIDGETPLADPSNGNKTLSFAAAAANALLAPEKDMTGQEQVKRFMLATRIYGEALPVKLSPEEVVLIRERVAKIYGPLVTGQMWQALESAKPAKQVDTPAESKVAAPVVPAAHKNGRAKPTAAQA